MRSDGFVLSGHEQPEHDGYREREDLEAPVFEKDPAEQLLDATRRRRRLGGNDFVFYVLKWPVSFVSVL